MNELTEYIYNGSSAIKNSAFIIDAQYGCGLGCAALSLLIEMSPLIGRHSAVQAKGKGLAFIAPYSISINKKDPVCTFIQTISIK